MDLLRIHVRLIMVGVLTMEESKTVLSSAFFALRRFGLNAAGALLQADPGTFARPLGPLKSGSRKDEAL